MYLNRTLEMYFKKASKQFPVLMVTGARQVGKTTFLQHLRVKNRTYISLDDPMILSLAKNDPALFFQKYSGPLLIDEIQHAPELLPYIKIEVDKNKKKILLADRFSTISFDAGGFRITRWPGGCHSFVGVVQKRKSRFGKYINSFFTYKRKNK